MGADRFGEATCDQCRTIRFSRRRPHYRLPQYYAQQAAAAELWRSATKQLGSINAMIRTFAVWMLSKIAAPSLPRESNGAERPQRRCEQCEKPQALHITL